MEFIQHLVVDNGRPNAFVSRVTSTVWPALFLLIFFLLSRRERQIGGNAKQTKTIGGQHSELVVEIEPAAGDFFVFKKLLVVVAVRCRSNASKMLFAVRTSPADLNSLFFSSGGGGEADVVNKEEPEGPGGYPRDPEGAQGEAAALSGSS